MLKNIIAYSIQNKLVIALFVIGLIGYGSYQVTQLPIDAQPDITNNQVQVITVASSYGAADIERLVTFPIEQATASIQGLTETRSLSRFGLSLITLVFDDETDVYWARQQVTERLSQVVDDIPPGIGQPELGPVSTGLGEIFQYVVRPLAGYENQYDATALRTIQDWTIRRQLLGTAGVAEVSSFGGKLKQFEVALHNDRLRALGVSSEQVVEALDRNNQNSGGAYIEKRESVQFIRTEGLLTSIEDIANCIVKTNPNGLPVRIRDVADVTLGHATRYGAMTYNDQGEVAGALVLMRKGENANQVVQNIKARLAEIEKTLPEGVVIEPFLDRAKLVESTIDTVKTNLIEGALIVVFILVVFLGNLRAGFLVASVIPLSMLFAICLMNALGVGGNLMSLGALDFGLIVDGAVIIVEAVLHQLGLRKTFGNSNQLSQEQMDKQVGKSATTMVNSAVFGQLIIFIVYLPILALDGIEGKMFIPMAQTVAFALLGAFILSLTYVPMMSALVLDKKWKTKSSLSDRILSRVEQIHRRLLIKTLQHRRIVLVAVTLLFVGAVALLTRMGGEFIPALEEGDFAVEMRILPGSSIDKTKEVTTQAAKLLLDNYTEVEKVVTKIGSAEIPTEPMPMDAGDMIVVLKPKKEWTSATSFPELSEKMSTTLQAIPGLTTGFQFPVQMRFNELMTGARQDIVCKIYGHDLDSLSQYAEQLGRLIQKVDGAQDLYIEPMVGAPQLVVDYRREALARYQVDVATVNQAIQRAFAGQIVGQLYEGEKRFDIVIRMKEDQKQSITDLRNLLVTTQTGMQIPLQQLAQIELINSPNQIQRENTQRRIVVGFNVRGKDVQTVVHDLQQQAEQELQLPKDYRLTYGGAFENLDQAKARLSIAVPVALLLIFLLLYWAFRSLRHSLLIYTAIPLSAIGGVYLLVLRDMPFSISAGVGFIALFGVAVLNGIVLIAEFNRLQKESTYTLVQVIIKGTQTRLRPVLMTALVASLGFLPMALSQGAGAEVQRPLATVVIGGLLLATGLTLFVLPLLYLLLEKRALQKNKSAMNIRKTILLALSLGAATTGHAQKNWTLEDVLVRANSENLQVKHAQKLQEWNQERIKTAWDISPLQVSGQWGQIQGLAQDNAYSVEQTFAFPTVYNRHKKVLESSWRQSQTLYELTQKQIGRQAELLFYDWLVSEEKRKILEQIDSLYTQATMRMRERIKWGENTDADLALAELQQEQVRVQLLDAKSELQVLESQLQTLLQSETSVRPVASSSKWNREIVADRQTEKVHPELTQFEQEVEVQKAQNRYAKSQLLPDLSLGYTSQSMKELQQNRFNYIQAGIGIPVFAVGKRAEIKATARQIEVATADLAAQKAAFQQRILVAQTNWKNQKTQLERYESALIPQANRLLQHAKNQLHAGQLNFTEWVILTHQAIQIQSAYLSLLDTYNQWAIELAYLNAFPDEN